MEKIPLDLTHPLFLPLCWHFQMHTDSDIVTITVNMIFRFNFLNLYSLLGELPERGIWTTCRGVGVGMENRGSGMEVGVMGAEGVLGAWRKPVWNLLLNLLGACVSGWQLQCLWRGLCLQRLFARSWVRDLSRRMRRSTPGDTQGYNRLHEGHSILQEPDNVTKPFRTQSWSVLGRILGSHSLLSRFTPITGHPLKKGRQMIIKRAGKAFRSFNNCGVQYFRGKRAGLLHCFRLFKAFPWVLDQHPHTHSHTELHRDLA